MPRFEKETLTVPQIKKYRDFVFPRCLGDRSDGATPFLSASATDDWISHPALRLYGDAAIGREEEDELHQSASAWEEHPAGILVEYLNFILPPKSPLLQNIFFDLENADQWVLDRPFRFWIDSRQRIKKEDAPKTSSVKLGKRKAQDIPPADVIEISSGEEDILGVPESKSRKSLSGSGRLPLTKRVKTEDQDDRIPDASTISDDERPTTSKAIPTRQSTRKGRSSKMSKKSDHAPINQQTAQKVTRSYWVQHVKHIDDIPSQWDVSHELTGYVVDLTHNEKFDLEQQSIAQWIRHECQCSLKGSQGSLSGDVYVEAGILGEDAVWCRRADFKCKGIKVCEFIDEDLLNGFESWEFDRDELKPFWKGELDANEVEAANVDAGLLRFYLTSRDTKCKIKCDGKAVLRKIPAHRPNYGNRSHFIGCSKYRKDDPPGSHRSIQIPIRFEESLVLSLFENQGQIKHKDNIELHGSCSVVVHPRSHQTECPFTHVINNQARRGLITDKPCFSRLLVFEPVDGKACRKALVVPEHPHNHPRHPHARPTHADKQLLSKVTAAAQKVHITPKDLRTSSTTREILGGRSWEEALPSLTDNQRLRRYIRKGDKNNFPEGFGWKGLQHEFEHVEALKDEKERYIHSVISKSDGLRLVVTMHPELAHYIHMATFLVIDYTFKRVAGDLNEWAVVSMLERYQTRIQFASLYCNKADRDAFKLLISEFFETVKKITGKKLEFFIFNNESKLLCLIFDAEAAQMQGCGDHVLPMNIPEETGITTRDPLVIVQHVTKTCVEHFYRNIDELSKNVPRDVIDRLKSFPRLKSDEDISSWRTFCRDSPQKEVRDWYANKEVHKWYLPSLNGFLSPMARESWENTPSDSNIGESGHAFRHGETTTGAPILVAIAEARIIDARVVGRLKAYETNFLSGNRWNSLASREKKSTARRSAKARKADNVQAARVEYKAIEDELEKVKKLKKDSLDRSRDIKKRLIELANNPSKTPAGEKEQKDLRSLEKSLVSERRPWNQQISELEVQLEKLKSGALKNARVHDPRPLQAPLLDRDMNIMVSDTNMIQSDEARHGESSGDTLTPTVLVQDAQDQSGGQGTAVQEDANADFYIDPFWLPEVDLDSGLGDCADLDDDDLVNDVPWQMDPECERILNSFIDMFPEDM